jgi:K+-transporting ATPase KdpF subunit
MRHALTNSTIEEKRYGLSLPWISHQFLCGQRGYRVRLRTPEEAVMTWLYILGGITSLGLLIYLVIALLKPELFS